MRKAHPAGGEDRPYGNASYYLVTDQLIMLDGPGSVMTGGWTPSADFTVTGELKELFEKGTETLQGPPDNIFQDITPRIS